MGGVAGQHEAVGGDDEEAAAPAVHAGLGVLRVVVGRDEQHLHPSLQALAGCPGDLARAVELLARGQELRAIAQGPAEVLRVGQL